MIVLTYDFTGYYNVERADLPETSGIYVLYAGRVRSNGEIEGRIIYVGQTINFLERVPEHIGQWNLAPGSKLYATLAEFDKKQLDWAEAALVFALRPRFNNYLKDKYNYPNTELIIKGDRALMKSSYEVCKGDVS